MVSASSRPACSCRARRRRRCWPSSGPTSPRSSCPGSGDQVRWLPISLTTSQRLLHRLQPRQAQRHDRPRARRPGRTCSCRLADQRRRRDHATSSRARWTSGASATRRCAAPNPGLVYATGSAFGAVGPDAEREGADLSGPGRRRADQRHGPRRRRAHDRSPSRSPTTSRRSTWSAGVLAALIARERTGRGQRVDVSLLGSQIWAQASEYTYYLSSGELPGRAEPRAPDDRRRCTGSCRRPTGGSPSSASPPQRAPAFYDGDRSARPARRPPLRLAAARPEPQKAELFALLAEVFVDPHDRRVVHDPGRRRSALRPGARLRRGRRGPAGVGERLPGAGRRRRRRADDRRLTDRAVRHARHAGGPPPALGADTDAVLSAAGYSDDEIVALRRGRRDLTD